MPTLSVVEDLDLLKERAARLQVGAQGLAGEEFALQDGEEAFGYGVVVAIADRPHRAADAHGLAALPKEQRGILATMVGVMDHPIARSPVPPYRGNFIFPCNTGA
jgi:hypothetical protein